MPQDLTQRGYGIPHTSIPVELPSNDTPALNRPKQQHRSDNMARTETILLPGMEPLKRMTLNKPWVRMVRRRLVLNRLPRVAPNETIKIPNRRATLLVNQLLDC